MPDKLIAQAQESGLVIGTSALFILAWISQKAGLDERQYEIYSLLLMIDFVFGIVRVAKCYPEKFRVSRIGAGLAAKMIMASMPPIMGLAMMGIGLDGVQLLGIGMQALIITEFYSILASALKITKNKDLPEWEALSVLANIIRKFVESSNRYDNLEKGEK